MGFINKDRVVVLLRDQNRALSCALASAREAVAVQAGARTACAERVDHDVVGEDVELLLVLALDIGGSSSSNAAWKGLGSALHLGEHELRKNSSRLKAGRLLGLLWVPPAPDNWVQERLACSVYVEKPPAARRLCFISHCYPTELATTLPLSRPNRTPSYCSSSTSGSYSALE